MGNAQPRFECSEHKSQGRSLGRKFTPVMLEKTRFARQTVHFWPLLRGKVLASVPLPECFLSAGKGKQVLQKAEPITF